MASIPAHASGERSELAITVVVPPFEEQQAEQHMRVSQSPVIHQIYPVHVWESRENGRREIIRVYELNEDENPANIPRDTFERDGFRFELAEIVRREIPSHSVLDHVETIELSTQTNDLESIIRLLAPTLDYLRDDGYHGVLGLDISSIQIASQGTTSSSFTSTRTREFPHLSGPDTALVPRNITDGGVTYNLTNVEWRTQSSAPIDHTQVATTYTAVATFSRVGTRTSTIGYTTTASYSGQISRIAVGRTEFTAYFIGIPIVIPTLTPEQVPDDGEDAKESSNGNENSNVSTDNQETMKQASEQLQSTPVIENVTVEQVHIGGIVIEKELPPPQPEYVPPPVEDEVMDSEDESTDFHIGNILMGLLFVGGMVLSYFIGKKGIVMLSAMRKASCVLLVFGMMFGAALTAYAAELPPYAFGTTSPGNPAPVVHMDTRENRGAIRHNQGSQTYHSGHAQSSSGTNAVHFHPGHMEDSQRIENSVHSVHFAPNRASPITATPEGYVYGETIGVLTVERLGRSVNIIAGATMEAMDLGAGHFSFTGLNSGNTALIGHNRGRSNGFFDFVRHLQEGDILTLEAGGITRSYAVSMMHTICYSDFSALVQFNDHRLSLVTCAEGQRTKRLVAVAIAVE